MKWGGKDLFANLAPEQSLPRSVAKFTICLLVLALLIFVMARPQTGGREDTTQRSGIEVVIAMDVSNSMLARDVSPNRLERSKMLVSTLIDRLKEDKIALQVFAGEAYPQLPITNDFVSAKLFLDAINTDMVTLQGTNLTAAIELASKSFTSTKNVGKAIVLITDGENHEGEAVKAAEEARENGMIVYVLGVGSSDGATIPTASGPLFDNNGRPVRTGLNEQMCRDVAKAGGGAYVHIDNSNAAIERLDNELDKLQKAESTVKVYAAYNEQFRAFALIALLLLIVEFCLFEGKNPWFKKIKISGMKTLLVLLVALCGGVASVDAQTAEWKYMHQGNKAFRQGDFTSAELMYRKALAENPRNARAKFNIGDAYLAQNNPQEAVKMYMEAAKEEENKVIRSMAFHNIGFVHHKNEQYDEAIRYYKEALRNNPKDDDTRYNLALCQKQKKDSEKNQQQQQEQQEQEQQQQQEQQPEQQENQEQTPLQKDEMSKDNADRLLELARRAEQQTREKLKEGKPALRKKTLDKNW